MADDFLQLGRGYFKLKQYDEALVAFTDAIASAPSPSVTLHDHRAATYEKLNDFTGAIKDGRAMIKACKEDIKGYLRTAGSLEKAGKLDTAIGILKYGMKNVPLDNKNYKLLQQLHDRLTRTLSPPTAVDPFTMLPVELTTMIMNHLDFREMVKCLRVSKGWKYHLTKQPALWTDLDFSRARGQVSRNFVREAFKRSDGKIWRVAAHRIKQLDILEDLATAAKHLVVFELLSAPVQLSESLVKIAKSAKKLQKIVIHSRVDSRTCFRMLRMLPDLEHAEFRSLDIDRGPFDGWEQGTWPKLRTLSLGSLLYQGHFNKFYLDQIRQSGQGLDSLTIGSGEMIGEDASNFKDMPLTQLTLARVIFPAFFPSLPLSLTHLTLRSPSSRANNSITPSPRFSLALPHLIHLDIAGLNDLTIDHLSMMLGGGPDQNGEMVVYDPGTTVSSLQFLSVRDATDICGPRKDSQITICPRIYSSHLLVLDLSMLQIGDDQVEWLVGAAGNLQVVNLSYTKVTGAGVKMLVDGLPDLHTLNLDGCAEISSRDSIEYAQKRGITIAYKMRQSAAGGRKVRYG